MESHTKPKWRTWDWSLILVTLVAAIPRLARPGMYILWWDEVLLLRRSLRLVALGEWTWLSNRTTWAAIPIHSPFNTYVVALPYLVTRDPRAPRVMIGVLGVLAVIILYLVVRRYYGGLAATLAGLLLALSPQAIDWARWVWNPNLAQIFIAGWLLTGLLGYFEGKRWAQVTHWLMLSLAGQAHLGHGFLMTPLSVGFLALGWWRWPDQRRVMWRATLVGWGMLVISLIPWIIGLIDAGLGQDPGALTVEGSHATWPWVKRVFSQVVSSTEFWTIRRVAARDGEWWPPLQNGDRLLLIKSWITLLGGIWLLLRLRRKQESDIPGAVFALLLFWPISAFLLSPIVVADFYLMPMMFGAYAVQGVVLAELAQIRRWTRWPVLALVVVFLLMQGWIVVGIFRWFDVGGNLERYRAPIDTTLGLLDDWRAEADQVVVLTETQEAKYAPNVQGMWWEVIGGYHGPDVILMPQGIPLHTGGEVIVGSWTGTTIPKLFGEGEPQGVLNNGEPMFRKVVIPPDYPVPLDYQPETLSRFANGIQVRGLHTLAEIQPGSIWPVVLVWSPDRVGDATQYQFSLRVMVGETTYGQTDMPVLHGPLWPPGERVINLFEIPIAADLPPDAELRFQVIAYSWPDMATVSVTDDDGNPVEPWLFLNPTTR